MSIFTHISKNDLSKVVKSLKTKPESIYDKDGYTPLTHCCKNRKTDAIICLLENGVDPDELDNTGKSALHHTAMDGYEDIAQHLINKRARLNLLCKYKNTSLHYAVQNNRLSMVRYLLDLLGPNPQIEFENMSGKTPLGIAKENGCDDIVNLLQKTKNEEHVYLSLNEKDDGPAVTENLERRIVDLENEKKKFMEMVEELNAKFDQITVDTINTVITRNRAGIPPPRPPKAQSCPNHQAPPVPITRLGCYSSPTEQWASNPEYTNLVHIKPEDIADGDYIHPLDPSQTATSDELSQEEQDKIEDNYATIMCEIKLDPSLKAKLLAQKIISREYMKKNKDEIVEHIFFDKVLVPNGNRKTVEDLKKILQSSGQDGTARLL